MGAVFFMLFLAILFFVAMPFVIVSTVVIIIWIVRKRKGRKPRKWLLIVPTVVLIISSIIALLPVGYIGFLRYVNSIENKQGAYVKTGKMLYWSIDNSIHDCFEMDGLKYVEIHDGFPDDRFSFHYEDKLGKPVANIKNNPENSSFFNEFMTWLLTGSTADKLSKSTIYPLKNDNEFQLYHVNDFTWHRPQYTVFCPKQKLKSIRAYYMDIANYETENITVRYNIYSDGKLSENWFGFRFYSETWNGIPYKEIKEEKILSPNVFIELDRIYDEKERFFDYIDVPEKYGEVQETAAPGTPVYGYDIRELNAYTKDRLAYWIIELALIEEQVYIFTSCGNNYIHGYPLRDEEINQYIINTIFND